MLKHIYSKYIITFLGSIVAAHLIFSSLMSMSTSYFYSTVLMNVRNLKDGKEAIKMSNAYLSAIKSSKKPVLLVLGSSFSYGHGIMTKDIYSNLLAKHFPQYSVMNASVIGNASGALTDINYLRAKNINVDTLIIELNLFNLTSNPRSLIPGVNLMPHLSKSSPTSATLTPLIKKVNFKQKYTKFVDSFTNSYFNFYLLHPYGLSALSNLDLNSMYSVGLPIQTTYKSMQLPDNYSQKYSEFRKNFLIYKNLINDLLYTSSKVAKHVYFFVSPIYADGVRKTQFKLEDIEKELRDFDQICHEIPNINCLNFGVQSNEHYFSNLSHYNEKGHQYMAKYLAKRLQSDQYKIATGPEARH